mmetsp:Transcript_5/g.5  ORF Transcript_5/g.5 Transcript_5/m.5 type:complete len:83 (+) Transcript_5:282-530(+)
MGLYCFWLPHPWGECCVTLGAMAFRFASRPKAVKANKIWCLALAQHSQELNAPVHPRTHTFPHPGVTMNHSHLTCAHLLRST